MRRHYVILNKEDIAAIFEIQKGICYFCGDTISMRSKDNGMHVDHYNSIRHGGTDDISNLVLTCASCNLKKGAMHGDDYERYAKKLREPEIGRRLGKIRKKLNRFRAAASQTLDSDSNT